MVAAVVLLIIETSYFFSNKEIVYPLIVLFVGFIIQTIWNFMINDIVLLNSTYIELTNLRTKKQIILSTLKIFTVSVLMGPIFMLETNHGNFRINFTRSNFNVLVSLLTITGYEFNEIEKFKKNAKTYVVPLKEV
jgi:uncharacterized membrane protein